MREFAKRNQAAVKPRAALATLRFGFLSAEMEPQGEPAEPVKSNGRPRRQEQPAERAA